MLCSLRLFCFFGISNDFSLGRAYSFALRGSLCMSLLGSPQEVTKKRAKVFPLGSPLALPRYKASLGEKHIFYFYFARHIANTRGRRKQHKFAKAILSWWSEWEGAHELAELLPRTAQKAIPLCHNIHSLKVLEGVWGNFFQEVPPQFLVPLHFNFFGPLTSSRK